MTIKLHEIDDPVKAAEVLHNFLREYAKDIGMKPDIEVGYAKYAGSKDYPAVCFEAGPYEWGVRFSLGGKPFNGIEYDPRKQDNWYLEPHYSFDVCFIEG